MAEDANFKFGAYIDDKEFYPKIWKIGSNGNTARVTWPTFKILGPSISTERLKIQTSNLVHGLTTRRPGPIHNLQN